MSENPYCPMFAVVLVFGTGLEEGISELENETNNKTY
jgi:hypothetical protein